MKKWYDEEYEWEIEVIGFLRGDRTENYWRNGEEVADKYTCSYGCPVNTEGQGICSKADYVSNNGSCQKWWEFREYRRN